jgi:hypothetical protein
MAWGKKDQAQEGANAGNAGENAAQLDEGQSGNHDLNSGVTEQQETGNAGGNTAQNESGPEGEEGQQDQGEQGKSNESTVPPVPGKVTVFSESRKGKTIIAVSGEPIVFDDEGKATVNEEDALYLKTCPGFIVG